MRHATTIPTRPDWLHEVTATASAGARRRPRALQFCAFDIVVEDDDDLRRLPLHLRKNALERLLARRPEL